MRNVTQVGKSVKLLREQTDHAAAEEAELSKKLYGSSLHYLITISEYNNYNYL